LEEQWQAVTGVVVAGHRLASGMARSKRYPKRTIPLQIPVFRELGLDLADCNPGILNISIEPRTFEVVAPEYRFTGVKWLDSHAPENFSFSRCRLHFAGTIHMGWVYYPDPKTKERYVHGFSLFEILAPRIPRISYESPVVLDIHPAEILIR
jgi:hypothetical protein